MNTTTVYSTTTSHPPSTSEIPYISGFWASTPQHYVKVFSVLIPTTLSISIACCVLSLSILIGCKKHKSLAKKNIISLIATLLIFDILLFCELCHWNPDYVGCYTAAVISQWAKLCTMFWMNVLAFDIWGASYKMQNHDALRENHHTKWFIFYALYAWGVPGVYVGISIVIDHLDSIPVQYKPGYVQEEHRKCWACTWKYVIPNVIYTIAPSVVLLVTSLVLLWMTYINIKKTTNLVENVFCRRVRKRFSLYVNVTVFRDVTFIVGFIPLWHTWYIIITLISFVFNTLLGLYLFVLFVFNKKKVSATLKWIRNYRSNSLTEITE